MENSFSFKALPPGILASFAGFAGSFAIVIQGLSSVGATPAETASGLMMLSIFMGVCAVFLSLQSKMPISIAWSTPGAAFLTTLAPLEGGFAAAVGAFIVCALLIIASGLWRPLGRAISAIPTPLASGMLAGVLLPLCLAPFEAIVKFPLIGLPTFLAWMIFTRINKLLAVPAAVLVAAILVIATQDFSGVNTLNYWSKPLIIAPVFTLPAIISVAIPLFIITMASQNITGIAVLSNFNYKPDPGKMFGWTGLFSLFSTFFGGHAINLAAITAAICAGEDTQLDARHRYWTAVVSGVIYIIFGLLAGVIVSFVSVAPPIIIAAVAGLALIGALISSFVSAVADVDSREAAVITFLVTASGVTFFGISGAFWGLIIGGAIYFWDHRKKSTAASSVASK